MFARMETFILSLSPTRKLRANFIRRRAVIERFFSIFLKYCSNTARIDANIKQSEKS